MIKLVQFLWLSSTILAMGRDYQCQRLDGVQQNCINNPRIRMTKNMNNYRLELCSNISSCTPTDNVAWIKCRDVCTICRSLPGQHGKNAIAYVLNFDLVHTFLRLQQYSKRKCEEELDRFLNDYCASATYTSTVTTTTTRWKTTSTITTTEISTVTATRISTTCSVAIHSVSPKHTPLVYFNKSINDEAAAIEHSDQKGTVALGVLLGLSLLLLAVLATGWILTCLKMKRRVALEHDR